MSEYADEVRLLLDQLQIQKAIIGGEDHRRSYVPSPFLKNIRIKVTGLILSDTQSIADSPEAKAKREATAGGCH